MGIPILFLSSSILIMLISQNYDFSFLGGQGCSDDITLFAINEFNNDISTNVFISVVTFTLALYAFFCNMIVITMDSLDSCTNEKNSKFTKLTIKEKLKILEKEILGKKIKEVLDKDGQSDDEHNSLVNTFNDTKSEDEWINIEDKFSPDNSKIDYKNEVIV